MNDDLQDYARGKLKEGLVKCTKSEQNMFIRMYSNAQPANLGVDINMIVDEMSEEKLDRAMQQVSRTLENKNG